VERLLADGASTAVLCGSQREPLSCRAARSGRPDVLEALLRGGADPRRGGPLCVAVAHGQEECVRLLLQAGAEADVPTARGGETPLHMAAKAGHTGGWVGGWVCP
jgi:ankyrin repeat protein